MARTKHHSYKANLAVRKDCLALIVSTQIEHILPFFLYPSPSSWLQNMEPKMLMSYRSSTIWPTIRVVSAQKRKIVCDFFWRGFSLLAQLF